MAKFELNLYGENDEIIKTLSTDRVRWGIFTEILELEEKVKDATVKEQLDMIVSVIKKIFPGVTSEELEAGADAIDIFNLFKSLTNIATAIKTKNG